MPTKKPRAVTRATILKFNPDWIKDPPPPFFKNLDRLAIREIAAAKKAFTAQIKEILARSQKR